MHSTHTDISHDITSTDTPSQSNKIFQIVMNNRVYTKNPFACFLKAEFSPFETHLYENAH